jgi:hypothetical protein
MTLKDKFLEKSFCMCEDESQVEKFVKIADDYAIEFAEWILNYGFQKYSNGWEKLFDSGKYTTQELLEIFKKGKEL